MAKCVIIYIESRNGGEHMTLEELKKKRDKLEEDIKKEQLNTFTLNKEIQDKIDELISVNKLIQFKLEKSEDNK